MKHTAGLIFALIVATGAAIAGPPLICHPFITGSDPSLPWGSDRTAWNNPDLKYDTARLAADTLRLLDSGKTILARMETLRRAAVYSSRNAAAGLELANRLFARALESEIRGQTNSLSLFDAGYFVESMKQMSQISKSSAFAGMDGYNWVRRSLPALQDKLTAEFALGLMQTEGPWPNEHIRRAVAGAEEGSLLARNLVRYFPNQTIGEIKRALATRSASR